jgi:hypothetical protein
MLMEDVERWNQWRREHPRITPILSGTELIKAKRSRANFEGAILRGTNLTRANLREADLRKADLAEAGLEQADLGNADLDGAILSDVCEFGGPYSHMMLTHRPAAIGFNLVHGSTRSITPKDASKKLMSLPPNTISSSRLLGTSCVISPLAARR